MLFSMDARVKPAHDDHSARRRGDGAFRSHDRPAAILLADCVDAAKPRHQIALLHFDDAVAPFEKGRAAMDIAQYPTFEPAGLARDRLGRGGRGGHILERSYAFSSRNALDAFDRFVQL